MSDVVVNAVVRANARQLVQEVVRTRAEFRNFGNDAVAQGQRAQTGLSQAGRGADMARRQIDMAKAALIGFFSVQAAARGFADLRDRSDAYANLTAKIKLASEGSAQFVAAEAAVFEIAQRTSASLDSVATLYSRMYNALKDQGTAQGEVLQMTETINQALSVSGATASEASAAVIQLSQAFAAGALRGQDFNSINSMAPRLMQALASSLGVTRGQLRDMAEEGKITSDVLRRAFSGEEAKKIAEEYSQLPLTIERSLTQLDNAFTRYIGQASASTGAGAGLAASIQTLADNFDALVEGVGILAAVLTGRLVSSLGAATAAMVAKQLATIAALRAEALDAAASEQSAIATTRAAEADVARARTLQLTGAAAGQVAAAEAALATATTAQTAASARATVAQRALASATTATGVATRGLGAALSLLGGPIGIAVAGFALLAMRMADASAQARQLRVDVANALDESQRARDADTIGAYQQSVTTALRTRAEAQDRLAKLEEARQRAAFRVFGGGMVGSPTSPEVMSLKSLDAEIASTRANITGLTNDINENNRRMTALSEANATGARTTRQIAHDSQDLTTALQRQTEQSRLNTIQATQGYRARLIAEAVTADGVRSEQDLSAARIAQIDAAARAKAAEEAASNARKDGAKSSRDAAAATRQHAEELRRLTEEQQRYRAETAQQQADNRGELFGADERLRQANAAAAAEGAQLHLSDADVQARIAAQTSAAQRQLHDLIEGARVELLQASGSIVEAATAEATAKYQATIDYLLEKGDTANAAIFQRLFNVDVARAQLQQLQQQADQVFADLQRQEQSLQTQVQTGSISEYEARQKLLELYREHGTTVAALIPQMEALARATGDPQAIERVRQMQAELERLNTTTGLVQQQLGQTFTSAASTAFEGLILQTKTLGEAVRGFFADMASGMARMASQALAQAAWSKLLGLFGVKTGAGIGEGAAALDAAAIKTTAAGGSILAGATALSAAAATLAAANGVSAAAGGAGGSGIMKIFGFAEGGPTRPGGKYTPAGIVHAGEYVMPQETMRYYGLDFLRAIHMRKLPRLHVPRISAPQPRYSFAEGGLVGALGGGAQTPQVNFRNINLIDSAALVGGYLDNPDSDRVFINKIARNGMAIKQVLGV